MSSDAHSQTFQFRCRCGALLAARASLAGRKGKCRQCGQVLIIPHPRQAPAAEQARGGAVAVQEFCSVCQTPIEEGEPRTRCDACGLPFHQECWQENLGCSAYGCTNVNVLKPGPDIQVTALPAQASPLDNVPPPGSLPPGRPPEQIPWEYVLLAASALAALLSMVTCGLPSLATGIAALILGAQQQHRIGWTVPGICIALSALGLLMGMCLSLWLIGAHGVEPGAGP